MDSSSRSILQDPLDEQLVTSSNDSSWLMDPCQEDLKCQTLISGFLKINGRFEFLTYQWISFLKCKKIVDWSQFDTNWLRLDRMRSIYWKLNSSRKVVSYPISGFWLTALQEDTFTTESFTFSRYSHFTNIYLNPVQLESFSYRIWQRIFVAIITHRPSPK